MSHIPHTRLHVSLELVLDRHDDTEAVPQLDLALREWAVHRHRLDDETAVRDTFHASNGIRVRESYRLSWPWPLGPAA